LHRISLPKKPAISGINLSFFAGKDSDKFSAIATGSAAGYGLQVTGQITRKNNPGKL